MALHINDMVSVQTNTEDGTRAFYRVQKLGGGYDLTLRLHTETSAKREESFLEDGRMLEDSCHNFITRRKLKIVKINAIGAIV